ncbi:solute carrier organic anion transporter family member 74D-like [Coccinella septempunctata]|uniref:solute carrier organic anion transporter family member 74D-like n=1 Tax=Coccinella septempunctata TaxID=41139 RepID=UPI001D087B8F|nr:solute carrier organic anion transporter family member 74D-like [Coccinella septempunctata]XP_044764846.1 solute carrier organic anion transporter family member 74D-like [Coccinella septempunctata]
MSVTSISNGKLLNSLDTKLLEPLNAKLIDPLETKFLEPMETKISNNNGSQNGKIPMDDAEVPEEEKALNQTEQDEMPDDSDTECGLGRCAPKELQSWATKEIFLIVFCLSWVLQGMFHTYFVSAITTIEKLFQIQSKVTGMIMSATEIGQIGSSLLLTYYGGQGHRPKWIAGGMMLFALSTFTCSLPHFIYGKQLINANELSGLTTDPNTCTASPDAVKIYACGDNPWNNLTDGLVSDSPSFLQTGKNVTEIEHRLHHSVTKIVLSVFFISLLGVGMGQTAVYTLGIPYIDDNVASKESPLYFTITIGVRILGPALGFIVGSFCSSIYADLSVEPNITTSDPRWVGAWWLGLVVISGMLMLTSIAMFTFPKRLKDSRQVRKIPKRGNKKHPSIRDFPKTVKRLLKNDILMYRTASSVLHILPVAGLYTFLPKYLESQFRLPTPSANMISGVGGILVMGVGIIISGFFILRVKPNPRFVAGWIASTAFIYALGMGILMFIGCPLDDFAGLAMRDNVPTFDMSCSKADCDCNLDKFAPICGEDGKTYLSPCQAGCKNVTQENGQILNYYNCLCIPTSSPFNETLFNNEEIRGNATVGYCETKCTNFKWYLVVFSVFVFVHSTSEVGSILLILRCVESRDKAMALGLIQFAIGLFGNVPCPIIYGAVVDSACLVWKKACGEEGACGLYDSKMFRMFFHGSTSALLLCAFLVDVVVWYKADNIKFLDEKEKQKEEITAKNNEIKNDTATTD